MSEITIVGGGIAGLVAAIECAEHGARVRLLEARSRLGGRATSTSPPFVANLGPHALYTGGSLWEWLRARRLHRPYRVPRSPAVRFLAGGDPGRVPPTSVLQALRSGTTDAPVDLDLRSWLADRHGDDAAAAVANLVAPLTFDHDAGRLSAAFVWSRVRRLLLPPKARYVVGGWSCLVDRLADHARSVGVAVATGTPVDRVDDLPRPVIVAVEPRAARALLGDAVPDRRSARVALLDVALTSRRRDPYLVFDTDAPTFTDRFTAVDRSLAPEGHELVQAMVGLAPGQTLDDGERILEGVLDATFRGWRDRTVWRRRAVVSESTGAVDLPGTTWRDRPPVAFADGIWLAGDWVAAPGHLAEVSCASAVTAADGATRSLLGAHRPVQPAPVHREGQSARAG